MSRFQTQVEVPRGIDETFAFVSDFSNAGKWDPNVQEASMLTPGPIGLASAFQLVGGLRVPFTKMQLPVGGALALPYQVVSYQPPAASSADGPPVTASIRLEGQNSLMRYVDVITFRGNAKKTTLSYDAQLQFTGLLRPLGWLAPQLFQKIGVSATRGMGAAIEANVAAPSVADAQPASAVSHAP